MKKKFILTCVAIMIATLGCFASRVGVYCYFDAVENHLDEDYNVKLVVATDGVDGVKLVIYNKTDNVIYVDKENSFAYTNDEPTNLFKNASYTTGTGSESGASVNLGGIAGALGIAGPIGSVLGGINVGGGSSNTNSTTTYEKRVLSVAPKSMAVLYDFGTCEYLLERIKFLDTRRDDEVLLRLWGERGRFIDPYTKQKTKFKKGMNMTFDANSSPARFKGVVKYSVSENFNESKLISTDNYMYALVIDSYKGVKNYGTTPLPYCTPYQQLPCCRFVGGTASFQFGNGFLIATVATLWATLIGLYASY